MFVYFNKLSILVVVIISLFSFNCQAQEEYTPQNTVFKNNIRYDLQNNPLNGIMRVYNRKSGKLFMAIPYKNGKMHGTVKLYDENGLLYQENVCKNGKKISSYYVA
ncbi:MAG: hypothetical protein IJ660_01965 [Alphaproteobacteria bacterium]|nr:hypothetical protein [Alphaproteobacteria bacterium]